jgi:hypothetical protein
MPTTVWLKHSRTIIRALPFDGSRDALSANVSGASGVMPRGLTTTDTETQFVGGTGQVDVGLPVTWRSERIAAQVTISGSITFNLGVTILSAGAVARIRAKLWKVNTTGVETLIVEGVTADVPLTAQSINMTFSATPSAPITLVEGERFVIRLYLFPPTGAYGNTTTSVETRLATSTPLTHIIFAETITFWENGYPGFMRDTKTIGIGGARDLAMTRGTVQKSIFHGPTVGGDAEQPMVFGDLTVREIASAEIQSTTNATTYASPSFQPIGNRLYLVAVVHSDAAPETTVPTITNTQNMNYVQVGSSMPFGTIASPGYRLTLFRAMDVLPGGFVAGTITVNLADAGTGCAVTILEVNGVVMTGSDGADAIRNISTNSHDTSANPSVTMGAFNDTDNATLMFVGTTIATVPTGGTGMTMLSHATYATPTGSVAAAFNRANDTAPDMVLASSAWAAIAIELVASSDINLPIEWISPRVASPGWTLDTGDLLLPNVYFYSPTNTTAGNMGGAVKLFRRKPDGTELLVATMASTTKLVSTAVIIRPGAGYEFTLHQSTHFDEDDRAILRPYMVPLGGSIAAGFHIEVRYDHPSSGSAGDTYVRLYDTPKMKAEGDAARDPAHITDGLSTLGLGN